MYRRLENSLPEDFVFPADLKSLGYYINERDQIRSITDPEQEFHYYISKNERVLEMHREAMNTCIRHNVLDRLQGLSLDLTRLPLNTPLDMPHVPVLTSATLSTAKRIILYIGESSQDLGIFAYRTLGQESIAAGSAIDFVTHAQATRDEPAIVVANMGQLIWYRRGRRAMTEPTFQAIPRPTAVSPALVRDGKKNLIPGSEGLPQHVATVFEEVLRKLASKEAKIDVIGVGDGALEAVEYLQKEWGRWSDKVVAIAVGASYIWQTEFWDNNFKEFWGKRGRAYLVSQEPLDTPLTGRDGFGCNCYSAGELHYLECIMPRAYQSMLSYFKLVADYPNYECEPQNFPTEEKADD